MKNFQQKIYNSFEKIAPIWPLQSFIANNNLQGFDNLDFKDAILQASQVFQKKEISPQLQEINLNSIKWIQAFLDTKQATIKMLNRDKGLFFGVLELLQFDKKLHKNNKENIKFLQEINSDLDNVIKTCLEKLGAKNQEDQQKIINVLTLSLPGFSGHFKYCKNWDYGNDFKNFGSDFQEFIALRLVISCLIVKNKNQLLNFLDQSDKNLEQETLKKLEIIEKDEEKFQKEFIKKLKPNLKKLNYQSTKYEDFNKFDAQMIFCIDVRSHSIRNQIEKQGNYKTYGFAGFFSVPVAIKDYDKSDAVASCPVLIKPQNVIKEKPSCNHNHKIHEKFLQGQEKLGILKSFYQSLKYSFTTPFALAESIGFWCGFWMSFKTFSPKLSEKLKEKAKNKIQPQLDFIPEIEEDQKIDNKFLTKIGFSLEEQCKYALNSLKMMGFCKNFAKTIIICGHKSQTQNNIYASALECGACGARHGGSNAKILATILNKKEVREFLKENEIIIPENSIFVPALHNTTNDEIAIFDSQVKKKSDREKIKRIKMDLKKVKEDLDIEKQKEKKSNDWSQTRPEWGLATNASFVIGPRILTRGLELGSTTFLHSYRNEYDPKGDFLETILTAPVIVTHWINSQYFFSSFDNISYGSGSKITQNISFKTASIQGNSSDLFSGLPLQSIFLNDNTPYHKPKRLNIFINAPKEQIEKIIQKHEILQKLFKNQWMFLFSLDEKNCKIFKLEKNLEWKEYIK